MKYENNTAHSFPTTEKENNRKPTSIFLNCRIICDNVISSDVMAGDDVISRPAG
jgi:hypothetical protein